MAAGVHSAVFLRRSAAGASSAQPGRRRARARRAPASSDPTTLHAWLHVLGFMLFLAALAPSYFFMWRSLSKDRRWAGYDWYTLVTGVLVVLLIFSDPLKALDSARHAAWWGAAGRLHLLVGLGWFAVIRSRLWRLSGRA